MISNEVLKKFESLRFPDEQKMRTLQTAWEEDAKHGRRWSPNQGEAHREGKESHSLQTYEFPYKKIEGYQVVAKYNFCERCLDTRNKRLVLFVDNVAYVREFIRGGSVV